MPSMTGNSTRLLVQPRDRELLKQISICRIVDREQVKHLGHFGSTTRANVRLLKLTRAGLLRRYFSGSAGGPRALYTLTTKGAVVGNAPETSVARSPGQLLIGDVFVEHQLALNSVYIAIFRSLPAEAAVQGWRTFRLPLSSAVALTPDGYFEIVSNGLVRPMFLEVDLGTETLSIWKKKIELYLKLATAGEFQNSFGHDHFSVLVVTTSNRRIQSLRNLVSRYTQKVFWFSNIKIIQSEGFWAPVWLRPGGAQGPSQL